MKTWIFQANPARFDIDAFLKAGFIETTWLVTRYAGQIKAGDQVFIWRSGSGKKSPAAGAIAEARIMAEPQELPEHPAAVQFWNDVEAATGSRLRAVLKIIRVASRRGVIKRDWLKQDPILKDLTILKMANSTNYEVLTEQAKRLNALWIKTGRDWDRAESLAGLWAYHQTLKKKVSRRPDSPVANVSILIGRAVPGVYNKVMNFRSIDPTDPRLGMSASSRIDQIVWSEFYDLASQEIDAEALQSEFARLWGEDSLGEPADQADAIMENLEREVTKLSDQSLEELLLRYRGKTTGSSEARRNAKPQSKSSSTRVYDRDPLIVAIMKKWADYHCEISGCQHPQFMDRQGRLYCEVHHIIPLADGGDDTLDNVVCLCPAHHAEVHIGKNGTELTKVLQDRRMSQPIRLDRLRVG